MKILIVGAGGFIGSHLAETILHTHKDWSVVALDISDAKITHLLGKENLSFIQSNILTNTELLEQQVAVCDVVLPLAAIASPSIYVTDPLRVFELDFEANLHIVRLAVKHGKRVIFPSTSEVYGMCSDEVFDEENSNCVTGPICKQRWIYSCSKQMLDRVIYAYGIRNNLKYTLFRPFNWVGPRLDDISKCDNGTSRVVTQFLSCILHGKNICLVDGGVQRRSFTYISDGIDALIKILENKNGCANQQIFNIGNPNNELTIRELAEKILSFTSKYPQVLGEQLPKVKIVNVVSKDYYGNSYQDVSRRVPSIRKAKDILAWTPSVGMDDLLVRTMDFYFA